MAIEGFFKTSVARIDTPAEVLGTARVDGQMLHIALPLDKAYAAMIQTKKGTYGANVQVPDVYFTTADTDNGQAIEVDLRARVARNQIWLRFDPIASRPATPE